MMDITEEKIRILDLQRLYRWLLGDGKVVEVKNKGNKYEVSVMFRKTEKTYLNGKIYDVVWFDTQLITLKPSKNT